MAKIQLDVCGTGGFGVTQFKFVVEQHADGFIAYPLGLQGVVVGEGDTADEALLMQIRSKFTLNDGAKLSC
jgi:hypothetical protein